MFIAVMMQEFDPLGIGSYMRSRMRELLGPDVLGAEPFEIPRFALDEPALESLPLPSSSSLYINPDVEWAFPEAAAEQLLPLKGPGQVSERARGHRPIPGGVGTEILETANARPARPPRRLFRVDVTENDDFYFLRADLAGMVKENVKISVVEDQNLVAIHVEPPKDDFFGLYKSPLESIGSIKKPAGHEEEKMKESMESVIGKEPKKEPESSPSEKEAEHKQEHPESPSVLAHKKEICHLIERCTQTMTRSLKMPQPVDMAKIEAEMRDGLLVVKFAKKEVKEAESMKKHEVAIK